LIENNNAFQKACYFLLGVLLLFHDFVHFLCWPKENEPKERAFLARINVIFAFGKTTFTSQKSLQGFRIFAACKCYDNEVAYTFLRFSEYYKF